MLSPIWKLSWTSLSPRLYGEKTPEFSQVCITSFTIWSSKNQTMITSLLPMTPPELISWRCFMVSGSVPICLPVFPVINKIHFCLRDNDRGFPTGLPWRLRHKESASNAHSGSIPGREDPLEKEMATHSSVPVWRVPGTEAGGRQPMGPQSGPHPTGVSNPAPVALPRDREG